MKRDHRDPVTTIKHSFQIDGDSTVYCKIAVSQVELANTWGRKVLANFVWLARCLFYQCSRDINTKFSLTYVTKKKTWKGLLKPVLKKKKRVLFFLCLVFNVARK